MPLGYNRLPKGMSKAKELKDKTTGVIDKITFAIGMLFVKIGFSFLGTIALVMDDKRIRIKKVKETDRPVKGIWWKDKGEIIFTPGNEWYSFGGNRTTVVYENLNDIINPVAVKAAEKVERTGKEVVEDEEAVRVEERAVIDPSYLKQYAPYDLDSNFGRRIYKDAIEIREAMTPDSSGIKEAAKILGGVMIGAVIYHFASQSGRGGGTGSNGGDGGIGIPNPVGTAEPSSLLNYADPMMIEHSLHLIGI